LEVLADRIDDGVEVVLVSTRENDLSDAERFPIRQARAWSEVAAERITSINTDDAAFDTLFSVES
jgi:hypothetical protein